MIIRRRKTRNFVQLENTLVRDTALSLDEHGMLHYLLSLPDDWEVSRAHCAKYWGIGRERAARIFHSLRKCGWAQVERIHGEDGTFLGVRWIITDEPGEPVADEQIDTDTEAEDDPDEGAPREASAEAAPPPAIADHDTAEPSCGSTVVRLNRSTANPYHGHYIDSKKTDSEENRILRTPAGAGEIDQGQESGPPEPTFVDLVKVWPPDHVLSRMTAEAAWQRQARPMKQHALDAAPRYLDDCRQNSRKVCDLTTYLREARFERLTPITNGGAARCVIRPGTPQWMRWREYKIAVGEPIEWMDTQASRNGSFTVRSEWPPALPPGVKARSDSPPRKDGTLSTAPPPDQLMTEEDEKHFT